MTSLALGVASTPRLHRPKVHTARQALVRTRVAAPSNGRRWSARWVENSATAECNVPVGLAWELWEEVELIPNWMPWIASVKLIQEEPRVSEWKLATEAFGRQWEFAWTATNLTPTKYQKIHWTASKGLNNTGAIRFVKGQQKHTCTVTLTISYEVPQVLAPVGDALVPFVEGILKKDMERFSVYARQYAMERLQARKAAEAAS